jgi:large subunit ribosomal protein L21e
VDIKANPSIHKGMPFKAYHGRTGVVFNVSRRAVGVRVNKQVNGRILNKRITVRVEHVKPSRCQVEIKRRVKENEALKAKARETGEKVGLKRRPAAPKEPPPRPSRPFLSLIFCNKFPQPKTELTLKNFELFHRT